MRLGRLALCGAALAMLLAAGPAAGADQADAAAGSLPARTLAGLCVLPNSGATTLCALFLRGSFEGLIYGQASMADGDTSFCLPDEGVSLGDVRGAFLHFLSQEPAMMGESAEVALLGSLEDRYPCDDDADAGVDIA